MAIQVADRIRFYGLMSLMNIAVMVMLYVINIPAPVPVYADAIPLHRKITPQLIPAITGTPTRIVVPSLSLDLQVGLGKYNKKTGEWTIGPTKAYYANLSVPANDSNGTTLIYGHAQWQVFGNLPDVRSGANALVYTNNGYIFRYVFRSMEQVKPTDTTIISDSGPPRLVLQTCIGDWDAYRALFHFSFVSVEKA